tara:strand:- start:1079 stop:1393 length:315 start_codon:yes stop_codon:yes gene_type:complete
MGKFSKSKGYRIEHMLVKQLNKNGIKCRRQPMSGAIPDFPHDIEIQEPRMSIEVKGRANGEGFKTLEKWKGEADILALHKDRGTTLMCLDINLFMELMNRKENT